jgi:hypothetical protein
MTATAISQSSISATQQCQRRATALHGSTVSYSYHHSSQRLWHILAAVLIVGTASCRLAYLTCRCPIDLSPDEAHYWHWSQHLDWSYYSKGPLVAYLVRGSTAIFGSCAQALAGTEMSAVRLPAIVCSCLLLTGLYLLTVLVYGHPKWALAVVAVSLSLPAVNAGALLMTIDAPYTCCWGWALVLAYYAIFRGAKWAWPATGLVVGLGILAKYTMLLWLPSLALFLLATRCYRRVLIRPGFWIMTATATAFCLPIIIWNCRHDWVTFRHVAGQAGLSATPSGLRWLGPFIFVGVQGALLLVFWFVAWFRAMLAQAPWKQRDPELGYLWWMSAPMFLVFLAFSFKTPEEPNWPIAAYLSGLVLTVPWLIKHWQVSGGLYRRLMTACFLTAAAAGLLITAFMHQSDWLQPLLIRVSPTNSSNGLPLRRYDPTCRLKGWRTLAQAVDRVRSRLQRERVNPVIASSSWTLPGELSFYCTGHPDVFSLGSALGERRSQYDLWRPNPLADAPTFAGRTFIIVGEPSTIISQAFASVEPGITVTHYQGNEPVARWCVTVCRGFAAFPCSARASQSSSY